MQYLAAFCFLFSVFMMFNGEHTLMEAIYIGVMLAYTLFTGVERMMK